MACDDAIGICNGPDGGFGLLYANGPFQAISGASPNDIAGKDVLTSIGTLPDDQRTELQATLYLPRPLFLHLDPTPPNGVADRFEIAALPAPTDALTPAIWIIRLRQKGLVMGPPPIELDFVDNLPLGLVLFDANDRLTWFNGTYHRVLGPNAHLLKTGERFEDIMSAAYRSGHAAGGADDIEHRIAERLSRHRNYESFEEALSGGRWLLTQEIATADGGTLGVRTDITEIKRAAGSVD